jgi:nitrite reductase (NO-forming)
MRELAVAIVFSALAVAGVLLLPYPKSPPQTVAVGQTAPEAARPQAEPVQPPTLAVQRQVQTAAQPVTGSGGDREQGRQVYRKCQACHSLEPGKNGIGPTLAAIVGKRAGSEPGFAYSAALRASGLSWDGATLDQFFSTHKSPSPTTRCPFPDSRPRTSAGT